MFDPLNLATREKHIYFLKRELQRILTEEAPHRYISLFQPLPHFSTTPSEVCY